MIKRGFWFKLIIVLIIAFAIRPIIFYWIFIWPTILAPYYFLKLMGYNTILLLNEFTIIANRQSLVFVTACVATAAYYLLTLLILFTKELSW